MDDGKRRQGQFNLQIKDPRGDIKPLHSLEPSTNIIALEINRLGRKQLKEFERNAQKLPLL